MYVEIATYEYVVPRSIPMTGPGTGLAIELPHASHGGGDLPSPCISFIGFWSSCALAVSRNASGATKMRRR